MASERKAAVHIEDDNVRRNWVVWSERHDGWWGANRSGYQRSLLLAGLYTEAEAKAIERESWRHRAEGDQRNAEARTLQDALEAEREWRTGPMLIDHVLEGIGAIA
jgi:hypothetical protein